MDQTGTDPWCTLVGVCTSVYNFGTFRTVWDITAKTLINAAGTQRQRSAVPTPYTMVCLVNSAHSVQFGVTLAKALSNPAGTEQ